MNLLSMRKCSWAMSGAFVAFLTFAAHGSTNVFNDAVFWFRGGKDLDGNGYMKTGEFFDDLYANDASHANHKMPMTAYTGDNAAYRVNAAFKEEQVSFPALGKSVVKNMRVLRISNVKGNSKYFPFVVNPHSIFNSYNISNEYTIVSRIRMDENGYDQCLFRIGYDGSASNGLYLAIAKAITGSSDIGSKYIKGYCTPNSASGNSSYQFNIRIPTNTWVDIAAVVGNGRLRVGIAAPESSSDHNNNPTITFAETPMWTDNCPLLGEGKYRLFCANGQTSPATGTSADTTSFIGSVQQLAIWGRALNDQEVMEAFGMPRPVIFRTGFDNGASTEFGGTRTGSAQTIDGLGSWQGISDTMLAGDEWTVNFNALRDEAGLAQIFSIKSLRDSVAAQIEPILNGTSLGERRVAENTRVFWPVATNLVVEGGSNVLTIRRVDNDTGSFLVDAIELGGSLGVGRESESATNDQRIPPDRSKTGVPSAADPNPQHWPQGLRPKTGVTNLHFRVWMNPDVVNKVTSRFWTRTKCEEEDGKTIEDDDQFLFYVNGANKGARGSGTNWDSDPIELIFNPGELNGGWNDVEFISTSSTTNCRWLVDYFRFETVLPRAFSIPPPGLSVIIR